MAPISKITSGGLFGKLDPVADLLPKPVQKFSDPLNIRKRVNESSTAKSLMDPLNLDSDPKRKAALLGS